MTREIETTLNEGLLSKLNKVITIDPRFKLQVWGTGVELQMVGSDNNYIFGSTINMYTNGDWRTKERDFKINAASMGSFNLSCEASVGRYLAMAEIIKHFDEVKKLCFEYSDLYEIACK